MPILILTYAIQLLLIVHVFKTGRNTSWAFILLCFPMIGGLAYFIVELLPSWSNSRSGQKVQKKLKKAINPDKELKAAFLNAEKTPTVDNKAKLAEQLVLVNRFQEAKELYESCLVGIYKNDPVLMMGLAEAYFGLADYQQVIITLDALKAANPEFKSQEGHLLYARAHENAGQLDAAFHEYETLITYYPGPEPTCRYALLLKNQGNTTRANELWAKIVHYSKHAGRFYNDVNKDWVKLAKKEVSNP